MVVNLFDTLSQKPKLLIVKVCLLHNNWCFNKMLQIKILTLGEAIASQAPPGCRTAGYKSVDITYSTWNLI